jgi:acetylornithine deacetylase/succinyl-diaminopimelate desuccinylase-like protein
MLGDNAIVKMAKVIKSLADYQPRVVVTPEVKRLLQAIAGLEGFDDEISEGNVDQVIRRVKDKNFAGYLTAITRMTVSTNLIQGGVKTNIVPDSCEADVDIRVLPGQDQDYVIKELGQILGDIEMEINKYTTPTFSTSDSESYRLIADTLKEFVGDALVLPAISSGGTDSRLLREAGIPSYGIGMITLDLDPAMRQSVHGKDEKIDIESLRLKSDFLVKLARRYLGD